MRTLGYLYLGVVYGVAGVVFIAATWFLVIGGAMEIFFAKSALLGIDSIDEANANAIIERGHVSVGMTKIFVIDPIVTTVLYLAATALALPGGLMLAASADE